MKEMVVKEKKGRKRGKGRKMGKTEEKWGREREKGEKGYFKKDITPISNSKT